MATYYSTLIQSARAEAQHRDAQNALTRISAEVDASIPRRSDVPSGSPVPCDPTNPDWRPRYYPVGESRRAGKVLPECASVRRTRTHTVPVWAHALHRTPNCGERYVTPSQAVIRRHVADREAKPAIEERLQAALASLAAIPVPPTRKKGDTN